MRRVFLDMDGVIVDFERYMAEEGLTAEEVKRVPGAYRDMRPIPDALAGVREIIAMGYDVWLATKPPTGVAYAYAAKAAWVFEYLPELSKKLILTHHKGMLGNEWDILVDDRPHRASCDEFRGSLIEFGAGPRALACDWPTLLVVMRALLDTGARLTTDVIAVPEIGDNKSASIPDAVGMMLRAKIAHHAV